MNAVIFRGLYANDEETDKERKRFREERDTETSYQTCRLSIQFPCLLPICGPRVPNMLPSESCRIASGFSLPSRFVIGVRASF